MSERTLTKHIKIKPSALSLLEAMGTDFLIDLEPIIKESRTYWILIITMVENDDEGILTNTRGEIRYFKDVNTAVELIKKYCNKYENSKIRLLPSNE